MPHVFVGAIGAGFAFTCPTGNFQFRSTGPQTRFACTIFDDLHHASSVGNTISRRVEACGGAFVERLGSSYSDKQKNNHRIAAEGAAHPGGTFQNHECFMWVTEKPKEIDVRKYVLPAALAVFVFTAQAAVAAEYYVVRDATTKKCTVVDAKPTTTTTTVVDNGTYKTKTEAESGMKTTKVCEEH